MSLWKDRDEFEKSTIFDALERNNWNISRAAKDLEISRQTLNQRIVKYDLRTNTLSLNFKTGENSNFQREKLYIYAPGYEYFNTDLCVFTYEFIDKDQVIELISLNRSEIRLFYFGNLCLPEGLNIDYINTNLSVFGDIYISDNVTIKGIFKSVKCFGVLHINNCPHFGFIPSMFYIYGGLHLTNVHNQILPLESLDSFQGLYLPKSYSTKGYFDSEFTEFWEAFFSVDPKLEGEEDTSFELGERYTSLIIFNKYKSKHFIKKRKLVFLIILYKGRFDKIAERLNVSLLDLKRLFLNYDLEFIIKKFNFDSHDEKYNFFDLCDETEDDYVNEHFDFLKN